MIPILPNNLIDVVQAPIPYIVGLNKNPDYIFKFNTNDAIFIKLDNGDEFINKLSQDIEEFPSLKKIINTESYWAKRKRSEGQVELEQEICKNIEELLKKLVSHFPASLIQEKNPFLNLKHARELTKKYSSKDDEKFIAKFVDTQMFADYIEEYCSQK